MIPERLLPHTATRVRAGTATDAYGDQRPDWSTGTQAVIRCRIEQTASSETVDASRDALIGTHRMFTNEIDVRGRDRIVHGGLTFEVVGYPDVVTGATAGHHLEAQLRVAGG